MEIKTEVTKVGNSLGLIIPSAVAKKIGISPKDSVIVTITPVGDKSRFFGAAKLLPSGQEVKDEERKSWS
ncbi:MAG: AbrB/MazE/SpoVT family DNA-binding domain-containing protein [Candidatus Altiarchaeota archaeon]|nr:AbrB/MazE/SpoVT family DNA-binding domain-containing protein [Candidatus Altiarchaeota archaeon]